MFLVKQQVNEKRLFLVVIDSSLKGKVLEDEERKIDIDSYEAKNELGAEETAVLVKKAFYVQCVGNEIISLLQKKRVIDDYSIIQGVKYGFIIH